MAKTIEQMETQAANAFDSISRECLGGNELKVERYLAGKNEYRFQYTWRANVIHRQAAIHLITKYAAATSQSGLQRTPQQIMDESKADLAKLVASSEKQLTYLYGRWQDEKEYEDFNDYIAEMKKLVAAPFTFVKATKRPFSMFVAHRDLTTINLFITITSRNISYGAVRK